MLLMIIILLVYLLVLLCRMSDELVYSVLS